MKMGDCEPSYGYGKAHVVSGHWFSPWHTGREPNLSNPFQGLFFWPGFLRGFLRGFWLFLPPPWTVQNGSERRMNGSGVFPPEKGMKNLRKNSRKNSRNNPCKGFWTVQNGSERRMNGSGVFPPEKGMKNLRKNSRKNSRNNPCKGFWTVQGFPPYHVKNSRWPVGSGVPMLAKTNLPEKIDGFPFAGFSWYAGWVGL